MKSLKAGWWILLFVFGLSSCVGVREEIPGAGGQPKPFQPPTLAASDDPLVVFAGPTPSPILEGDFPLPTLTCSNILTFLEDLTIPDGSVVRQGELLDKQWLIQNNGTCNWNEGYRLKLESGLSMGVSEEQALFPARSGSQAIIRIVFIAPDEVGIQRSAWQAYSPEGEAFGDPIFIEIVVEASSP